MCSSEVDILKIYSHLNSNECHPGFIDGKEASDNEGDAASSEEADEG